MSYETSNVLTPQKSRREINETAYWESDPAHVLQLADANHGKNCLVGVKSGLLVPAGAFTAALHATQAGAETAFAVACAGFNMTVPPLGKQKKVTVCTAGTLELACVAATYVAGELLKPDWDATNTRLYSNRWTKTTDLTNAVAVVVESSPMLPRTGNVTKIEGRLIINMQRMTTTA